MDLFGTIETNVWLGLPIAVFVGFILGTSPLAWPVMAAAIGVRAGTSSDTSHGAGRWPVLALGAGLTLVYATLGFATGSLDRLVREGFGAWSGVGYVVMAVASIGLGALMLARPDVTCRVVPGRNDVRGGRWGALAMGIPLGLVNCPACAGVITGVALAAGAFGSVLYAVAAMVALGVGHTLALWFGTGLLLRPLRVFAERATLVQRAGGIVLVLTGAFFVYQALGTGLEVSPTLP